MRSEIRDQIARIDAFDEMERRHLRDALDWIDSGAPLFRRSKPATPPKHLVSYFVMVDEGHVLLVDHIDAGLWLPPGGHAEPGEHPRRTVEREAMEELGIEAAFVCDHPIFLTVTETIGRTAGHVDVSLWYVLRGSRSAGLRFDRTEFETVRWFARDYVPLDRSEPHLERFMRKYGSLGPN